MEELPIKVSGRAVSYFGSQSISNNTSAVFELIKNSRDADAKKVSVTFENLGSVDAQIIIDDDGTGMTQDDIREKWLVAGTDTKIRNPRSAGGKYMLGEKGIGRFACEKLGKKTILESYPEGDKKICMSFDWSKYEKPGVTFDEIKHPIWKENKSDKEKRGLKITLQNINSNWKQDDLRKVTNELGTFVLPKELKGSSDIDIIITAEQYGVKGKHVEGTVTKKAPIKIIAKFDGSELSVKISDIEYNKGQPFDYSPEESFDKTCGPFEFRLYFYPRSTAKQRSGKYEQYYEDEDITNFMHDHSGIYLYKDGVWMKPLGRKDDWLNLEAKRVQRISKIGLSQVYGVIRITQKENSGIMSTSHRETVQDNTAFHDLKDMIKQSIIRLEKYRDKKKKDVLETIVHSPNILASNNVGELVKTIGLLRDVLPHTTFEKLRSGAAATKKYIEEQDTHMKEEIKQYGEIRHHEDAVIAIGLFTSYMASEISAPLAENIQVMANIRKTMETTDFKKIVDGNVVRDVWTRLENLEENTTRILHFTSFVRELSQHIAVSVGRKGKPTQFKVFDAWSTVSNGFKDFTEKFNITVSEDIDGDMTISFNRIDLEAILTNLFLNSVDALKKKDGVRRIHFEATYSNGLTIKFSDDGGGIKQEHLEHIFEPFYTIASNSEDTAHGHGLGLAIVKRIVVRHEGHVQKPDSPSTVFSDSGTTVTMSFPNVQRVATK